MKAERNDSFIKKRIKAFGYAFSGLFNAIKLETHLKIHLVSAITVIALGFYFNIAKPEWLAIIICIGLVISLELINSSIESLCNAINPEQNQQIKYVKDVLAAAVLIASLSALVIGLIVFIPYFKG